MTTIPCRICENIAGITSHRSPSMSVACIIKFVEFFFCAWPVNIIKLCWATEVLIRRQDGGFVVDNYGKNIWQRRKLPTSKNAISYIFGQVEPKLNEIVNWHWTGCTHWALKSESKCNSWRIQIVVDIWTRKIFANILHNIYRYLHVSTYFNARPKFLRFHIFLPHYVIIKNLKLWLAFAAAKQQQKNTLTKKKRKKNYFHNHFCKSRTCRELRLFSWT